ncbi:MAG: hypothetical protein IPG93_19755 [Burkholderiales bacterium]|nr:hypothetical protein [Burkholderiales bacterium]
MSRIWKSELRLELRINGCQAELRGPGLGRRLIASASASGRGAAAISAALSALRLADDIALLPADARLTVADEYVWYALLDTRASAQQALDDATSQFSDALGRNDLLVQVSPLPGGSGWLAAALLEADLNAWADALADAGVRLQHLHPALVSDLTEVASKVSEDDAVIALLRDQGATLVRLDGGVPAALAWERFDIDDRGLLDLRLQTFVDNTTPARARSQETTDNAEADDRVAIYLMPQGKSIRRYSDSIDSVAGPASLAREVDGWAPSTTADRSVGQRRPAAPAPASAAVSRSVQPEREANLPIRRTARLPAAQPPQDTAPAAPPGLAQRVRDMLERRRERRAERLRQEKALDEDNLSSLPAVYSPTGSLIADAWQDTQQQAADTGPGSNLDLSFELEAELDREFSSAGVESFVDTDPAAMDEAPYRDPGVAAALAAAPTLLEPSDLAPLPALHKARGWTGVERRRGRRA